MSYKEQRHRARQTQIRVADTPSIDAFGRLRVSAPFTLFESQSQYNASPLYWNSVLTGAGDATHLPNESSVRMRVTDADGDEVIRQTKRYWRYQPGKSQRVLTTFVLGAAVTGVRKRVGYFDAQNGIFLEQTAAGLRFVRRSYITGTAADTPIEQADWNVDQMDGTGPSNMTLDISKAQILIIDLEWLGVGRVRVGFVIDGNIFYAHEFNHANSVTSVYMTTANLPVRYEITNTAATAGNTDLIQICAEVNSEGSVQEQAQVFSVGNGATLKAISTTLKPVLSIRLDTKFPAGGTLTNRATVIPEFVQVFSEDTAAFYKVLYNATLTTPSWTDYNTTHSGVEYDLTSTGVTGGIEIQSGYVAATRTASSASTTALISKLALTLDAAGTTSDTLTVAAVRVGASDTDVGAVITWKELY